MIRAPYPFRIAFLSAALLAMTTGAALANSDDSDDPFKDSRTTMGFGMLAGAFSVGPVNGSGVGIHAGLGRQMGTLMLGGEYNMLLVDESATQANDPIRGLLHRVGLNARYNFFELGGGRRVLVQGSFWVEGGIGRQQIQWNQGGRLTRNDLALGFGAQSTFRLGKQSSRYLGIYYAFRATVAGAPDTDQTEPACGGPCDEPTGPAPYDLGLFFNMGVSWSR